jgi:hypothetical protein
MKRRVLALLLVIVPAGAHAQDVEPRALSPAPVGTNIVGVSLSHSWGAVLLDKTIPVRDLDGSTYSLIPSYTRFINFFGLTSRVTVALPLATGDWDALVADTLVNISRTGLGDAMVAMSVFVVGSPAMTPTEFRDYRRKTIVGLNIRVGMPTGQYDPDKLINLGSNRWRITPAVGVSHRMGKWTAEGYAGVWFFTDNTSAFGGNVTSQDPLFAVQLHLAYSFKPRLWLAAGVRQTAGGKTSVNGVQQDTPAEWTRLGLVLGVPVSGRYTLKLIGTTGVRNTTGNDFNTVALQWFYAF